jgi:phospholipid N-methyltransferase
MDAESCLETFAPGVLDVIISTLPLGSMSPHHAREILASASKALKKWGIYIQYQYFATNKDDIEEYFDDISHDWEAINFPPAFIYVCRK